MVWAQMLPGKRKWLGLQHSSVALTPRAAEEPHGELALGTSVFLSASLVVVHVQGWAMSGVMAFFLIPLVTVHAGSKILSALSVPTWGQSLGWS
jgi:hypothetical protein